MTTASQTLARYATDLKFEQIPPEVVERAKDCLIDTVAACALGAQMPWTQTVIEYAQRNSAPGESSVLGTDIKVRAPFACLTNGAAAHAFELDSLCEPSVGMHPGAALAVPGFAVAQGRKKSGKELIEAVVAGFEMLYRIGQAAHHSSEKLGFHAPGVMGVYGVSCVVAKLFNESAEQMAHAFGIAGSMSSGLMEFSHSGGQVKRLHLGRTAEGGFLAAALARDGLTGPAEVLEGKYGSLNTFARDAEPALMTRDLGKVWHTLKIKIKRFACHANAQVPVSLILDLKAKHGITGEDVARIALAVNEKSLTHHNIPEPTDLAMAQYSVPFSTALALFVDPADPWVFCDKNVNDPRIRALSKSAILEPMPASASQVSLATRVTLHLKNGQTVSAEGDDFKGTPSMPLKRGELLEKFLKLTAHRERPRAERLFAQLSDVENVKDISALNFALYTVTVPA
jgi:2-methylcitrate dehydratase PrpD